MKAPIHSKKHYVQWSFSQVLSTARNNENIVDSVAVADINTAPEVNEGSVIKAVFVELWLLSSSNDTTEIVTLMKSPAGVAPAYTDLIALSTYDNKKNILFTHQGLSANDGISSARRVIAQWFPIPKGKQRFGLGDRLQLSIANQHASATLDYCGMATYKEYS